MCAWKKGKSDSLQNTYLNIKSSPSIVNLIKYVII